MCDRSLAAQLVWRHSSPAFPVSHPFGGAMCAMRAISFQGLGIGIGVFLFDVPDHSCACLATLAPIMLASIAKPFSGLSMPAQSAGAN
jgi:hypothetical protein